MQRGAKDFRRVEEEGTSPRRVRKYIGVHFECCKVYTRVYLNSQGTAYVGWCPYCAQRVEVKIDKRGTHCRFFKVVSY